MKGEHLLLASLSVAAAVVLTRAADPEELTIPPLMKPRERSVPEDRAFWNAAVIPEPVNFREPSAAKIAALVIPPVDHRGEVVRLIAEGDEKTLNEEVAAWFEEDPVSVSDWLDQQESLEALEPAVGMIAGKLARDGDPTLGLEWAKLLQPGPKQEELFFDIYALAARGWRFSEAELRAAPLPPEKLELLLSGAAGD